MSKQIKSTDLIHVPGIDVHPVFFVPDDLFGINVTDGSDNLELASEIDTETDDGDTGVDVEDAGSVDVESLDVPEILGVVSATTRTASDGHSVIDVVIEVSEVQGATSYEIRVTNTP